MKIKVDGRVWFNGRASCVLFGNVGTVTGGLCVFPDAQPDDGRLEIGVVTAQGRTDWLRVLSRVIAFHPDTSPMVKMTHGQRVTVRLDRPLRYELDGGARAETERLRVRVEPASVCVCVPQPGEPDPAPVDSEPIRKEDQMGLTP
jgi:diacylglycerol kinase (ATP)